MRTYLLPSLKLTAVLILICAGLYPLLITEVARLAPGHGDGVTVQSHGRTVGYARIGQSFTDDRYFQGRPSAVNYHAAGSGGSNKGPSNPEYLAMVQARIDTFMAHNPGISKSNIPADLITASGSGLDPHLSPQAVAIQVKRIAKARGMDESTVKALITQHTEGPLFGLLGPSRVNVLQLNIALDEQYPVSHP